MKLGCEEKGREDGWGGGAMIVRSLHDGGRVGGGLSL